MYLTPTSQHIIPVHPSAVDGWETQKLAVDFHEYPGECSNRKIAYIFSHDIGFHKETLHPLMRSFKDHLFSLREYDNTDITFITWDARSHGDSARLNDPSLIESYGWSDNAMDLKQVIDAFQLKTKFDQVIGVGHGFGATCMVLSEFYNPNTFDGICVIEPALSSTIHTSEEREKFPIFGANLNRTEEWASREECHKEIASQNLFRAMHVYVVELYVKYGTYNTVNGTVKLKCSKEQEYKLYKESQFAIYLCYKTLQSLTIPTQLILGSKSALNDLNVAKSVQDVQNKALVVDIVEGTHMLPHDAPASIIPFLAELSTRVSIEKRASLKSKI